MLRNSSLDSQEGRALTWVAHLIQAGILSTHSPYAVSNLAFTLLLRGMAHIRQPSLKSSFCIWINQISITKVR